MNQNYLDDRAEREIERLDASNKKQEIIIRKLESKAVQNLNLYFIFQAVILASTSLASSTSCHNWWIPISLSLLASIINFASFSADMSNILKLRKELDQQTSDLAFIKLYKLTRDQVDEVAPGDSLNHQGGEIVRPKGGSFQKWKRRFLLYLSIGLFAGFTCVVMYGCHRILCHPGHRKCIDLCSSSN